MTDNTSGAIDLPLAWDRDRLVVTEQWAIDKIARKRLSPSTAHAILDNPARFAIEKLLQSQEENPFDPAPLGTDAHAVMETLMQLPGDERTIERADEILADRLLERSAPDIKHGWPGIPAERADEWVEKVHEAFEGLWKIEDPTAVDVHGTETRLDTVEIDGVPFIGFVDRTDNTTTPKGQARLKIVDYKTGKPSFAFRGNPNSQHEQIRLYILAMSNLLGLPTSHFKGALYFTKKKFSKAQKVPAPNRRLDDTRRRFTEAWGKHNEYVAAGEFPCITGPLCGWCPLVTVCPAAKAAGYGPRLEGLPTADQWNIPVLRPLDAPEYPVTKKEAAVAKNTTDADTKTKKKSRDNDREVGVAEATDIAAHSLEQIKNRVSETIDSRGCVDKAAHTEDINRSDNKESEKAMASLLKEDKPWEITSGADETLNPNSYSAMATFAFASWSVETLTELGYKLTGKSVTAMTKTLASIVATVQAELSGSTSFQDGLNARLRSALRAAMTTEPCPVGSDEEKIQEWVDLMTKRVRSIAKVAVALFNNGEPVTPDLSALSNVQRLDVWKEDVA